ncbi:dihydrolipoamide acetyltransferase [compost metagenome]
MTAAPATLQEPLASDAILEFAKENGVNIDQVIGTGKDGRIRKSDVEAVIAAQDLA